MDSTTRALPAHEINNSFTWIIEKSLWAIGSLFRAFGLLSMIGVGTLAVIGTWLYGGLENAQVMSWYLTFPLCMLFAIVGGKLLALRQVVLNPPEPWQ